MTLPELMSSVLWFTKVPPVRIWIAPVPAATNTAWFTMLPAVLKPLPEAISSVHPGVWAKIVKVHDEVQSSVSVKPR